MDKETVEIRKVSRLPLAVMRGRATLKDIGAKISTLLPEVYRFLDRSTVTQAGHNIVLYLDEGDRALITTPDGVPIEVGVQVNEEFTSDGPVVCSFTPAGSVAALVHRGPYQNLPQAHAAVRRWCAEHGRPIAGPNWEIYGDWTDDVSQLRTDVLYLLK
jgi:effector-binding domain-containing protein